MEKIHEKEHEGYTISDKPTPISDAISTPSVVAIPEIISETTELEVSKQHLTEIIYLSSPFQNLTFADEDASKEKTLDSLYLVEFDKQTQIGELSVIMDANFSKALNSPDFYLETACTYDNVYFNNARAVQVTEKGEIKLDGNDWNVTKKVTRKSKKSYNNGQGFKNCLPSGLPSIINENQKRFQIYLEQLTTSLVITYLMVLCLWDGLVQYTMIRRNIQR